MKLIARYPKPEVGRHSAIISRVERVMTDIGPRYLVTFRVQDGDSFREITKSVSTDLAEDSSLGTLFTAAGLPFQPGQGSDTDDLVGRQVGIDVASTSNGKGRYVLRAFDVAELEGEG